MTAPEVTAYELLHLFKNQLVIMESLKHVASNTRTLDERIKETRRLIELLHLRREMGHQ